MQSQYIQEGLQHARGRAIEECGELIAALGKSVRFGWLACNPELPADKQEANFEWVARELGDVMDALSRLKNEMRKEFGPLSRG